MTLPEIFFFVMLNLLTDNWEHTCVLSNRLVSEKTKLNEIVSDIMEFMVYSTAYVVYFQKYFRIKIC